MSGSSIGFLWSLYFGFCLSFCLLDYFFWFVAIFDATGGQETFPIVEVLLVDFVGNDTTAPAATRSFIVIWIVSTSGVGHFVSDVLAELTTRSSPQVDRASVLGAAIFYLEADGSLNSSGPGVSDSL